MSLQKKQKIILGSIFLILVVLNFYGFLWMDKYIQKQAGLRLEFATKDLADKIKARIDLYNEMLYGTAALFSASTEVTRDEWRQYMVGTQFLSRFPAVEAVGYAPLVSPDELISFQQAENAKLPGYRVYPNSPTEQYAPILLVEPLNASTEKIRGFNIYSDPVRKQALDYARDNNTIAVTNKIVLAQDQDKPNPDSAFILFLPLYKSGADTSTVEARRANLRGFVIGAMRSGLFVKDVSVNTAPGLKFQIFDSSSEDELTTKSLIYNSGTETDVLPGTNADYSKHEHIQWPNTAWHIRYVSDNKFGLSTLELWLPYIMMLRNITLSLAVLWLVYYLLKRFHHEARRADSAEARLSAEDAVVDALDQGIVTTNLHGTILVANKKAEQILGYRDTELVNLRNITDIIDEGKLVARAEQLTKELGTDVSPNFDALVTQALIDGKDEVGLVFRAKDGMTLGITCEVKPLFGRENVPVGYQFTFR